MPVFQCQRHLGVSDVRNKTADFATEPLTGASNHDDFACLFQSRRLRVDRRILISVNGPCELGLFDEEIVGQRREIHCILRGAQIGILRYLGTNEVDLSSYIKLSIPISIVLPVIIGVRYASWKVQKE